MVRLGELYKATQPRELHVPLFSEGGSIEKIAKAVKCFGMKRARWGEERRTKAKEHIRGEAPLLVAWQGEK